MSKRDKFVQLMKDIANDDSHGYSQVHRWPSEGRDFDCSSLVYWAAHEAGYNVTIGPAGTHYTGTIIQDFTKAGFRCDAFDGDLSDLDPGDILLNTSHHVAVYIGGGKLAEASIDEVGGITGPKQGDQTGNEIHIRSVYNYPWTNVLTCPEESSSSSGGSGYTPSTNGKLNGIDVSSHQPKNICTMVPCDFAIVKMSGNPQSYAWDYVNPNAKQQAKEIFNKTGCLGLYHFTWGKDANTEADFFLNEVKKLGYIGKAVLVIDYEAEATNLGRSWVKKFADRIKAKAGYDPVIYASGSVVVGQNLFGLGYPIWVANYSRGYNRINGYDYNSCTIYGGCEKAAIWQYTSSGYLSGYDGALDLDVFYGTKADWQKLAGMLSSTSASASTTTTKKEDEVTPQDKKDIAWEVLWGHQDVDGNKDWTLGGAIKNMVDDMWKYQYNQVAMRDRVYGMDCSINGYLPAILEIVEKVATQNGIDGAAVAKQVAEEVAAKLEKISLDVNVKE